MVNGLNLLLINPPTAKQIYQGLANEFSAIEPPWYAAATAEFVRRKGYSVEVIDANGLNIGMKEAAEMARELKPGLINIIAYGQQPSDSAQRMTGILEQTEILKEVYPESRVVVTGLYPTNLPEKTLRDVKCDFVGTGEGFYTVLGLLEKKEFNSVPGLWWRENGKAVGNPRADNIKNLDVELPTLAWDLLPMDKYRAHNWHCLQYIENRKPYASIYTSLGCVFNCSFCCINSTFGGSGMRYWNSDSVIGQIDELVGKYGVKNIKFIDEMFVLDKRHVNSIADKIIERGHDLNIWAYARVDTVNDRALLGKIKKAGVNWLALGIESGSKHVRDGVEKGRFGEDKIFANVQKIRDAGINIIGNYIFGLPDDAQETMQATLNLAKELNCEWANFYSAMAYPGSSLYGLARQKGTPLPDDEDVRGCIGYSQHAYETLPLPTDALTNAEVLRFRDKAHQEYFANPNYLSMVERKFGSRAVEHVKAMNQHKLRRKLLGD